jgi:hypothetical protein
VVAQHCTAPHVDDDQEPDALDLKLLLEAQWILDDDLKTKIEAVTIDFDDVKELRCRRCR